MENNGMTTRFRGGPGWRHWLWLLVALVLPLGGVTGCRTADTPPALTQSAATAMAEHAVRLNPGDVVQVTFPGAPQMNTTERVRLDGKILMPLIKEIQAAGKTPVELQADLVKAYEKDLQVKEVVVIVNSTSASVFISGAVNRPGKIAMERPMTVLDAIMEAGGFDPKRANIKKVSVIRQESNRYKSFTLDLKPVLKRKDVAPFYLQPFDIIFVPEKIF
jgi:polysaccharide biosynthesis/export protein